MGPIGAKAQIVERFVPRCSPAGRARYAELLGWTHSGPLNHPFAPRSASDSRRAGRGLGRPPRYRPPRPPARCFATPAATGPAVWAQGCNAAAGQRTSSVLGSGHWRSSVAMRARPLAHTIGGANAAGGLLSSTHSATAAATAMSRSVSAWNVVGGRGDVDRAAAPFRR